MVSFSACCWMINVIVLLWFLKNAKFLKSECVWAVLCLLIPTGRWDWEFFFFTNHVLLWHIYSAADIDKHMSRQWTYFFSFPYPFLYHHHKFRVSDLYVLVGFKVAVISRDISRLDRLRSLVSPATKDNLTTVVGNVGKLSCISNWEQEQPLTLQTVKKTELDNGATLCWLVLRVWRLALDRRESESYLCVNS